MAAFAEARKRYKPGPARRRKVEKQKYRRRNRRARPGTQLGLELLIRKVGGARKGSGRKRRSELDRVPHRRRGDIYCTDAIHVTWRVLPHVWSLRSARSFRVIAAAFAAACDRFGCRLLAYSVQGNHIHMLWEADSDRHLSRALNGLGTRLARGLNRVMNRAGQVLDGRFHCVPVRSGRQVRNVLQYFVDNARKHFATAAERVSGLFQDVYTSLGKLDLRQHRPWSKQALGPPVVAEPQTWLMQNGWQLA